MKNIFSKLIMFFIVIGITIGVFLSIMIIADEFSAIELSSQNDEVQIVSESGDFSEKLEDNNNKNMISGNDEIQGEESNVNSSFENFDKVISGKTEQEEEQIDINKYFYNQLEEPSKIIYDAFMKNEKNMRSGTYRIEFGDKFTNILKEENGQEKLGDYYQSAIEAYMFDNPGIFYLSADKMFMNIETTTIGSKVTYNTYIDNGQKNNYLLDEYSSEKQVENALNQIEKVKQEILQNKTGDTYTDIKMVHDYLVDNIVYDTSLSKENIYNIYGALINKECVCEGYARAFKYILDDMNIPCILVVGEAKNSEGKTENHAWNYVQINNEWKAIDTTWDDPIIVGGGKADSDLKYKYFLKSGDEFNKDHFPNGQFTEGGKLFIYPEI